MRPARPLVIAFVAVLCACAGKVAPKAAMAPSPPRPRAVVAAPEDYEREWHTWKPAALEGTKGRRPMYLVVQGEGCRDGGSVGKDRVLVCGRDAVRVGPQGLSFEPFRSGGGMQVDGELPERVFEEGGDVWVQTQPRTPRWPGSNDDPWDYFFVYRGSQHLFRDGKWRRFPTFERPQRYRGGWLVFDLPRFEKKVDRTAPGCADFGCARVLPLFWHVNVERPPDLTALDGKIAWIHPHENEWDWAYHVDPNGPVSVFMRALDLTTNKRVVGVLSWTEKDGAQFHALRDIDADVHFTVSTETDPKTSSTHYLVSTWRQPKTPTTPTTEVKYVVRSDGAGRWTAVKQPPPKPVKPDPYEGYVIPEDGPEIGGYSVNRGGMLLWEGDEIADLQAPTELRIGSHGDVQFYYHYSSLYRSVQPTEVFRLTDYWGDLHPWPEEAKADCPHPFVVFDALDEEVYGAIVDAARRKGLDAVAPWGRLPERWAHLNLVEFRLFTPTLIVIGASVTPSEAKELEKAMRWVDRKREIPSWGAVGLGGDRYAEGIYCARPVNPKPFEPLRP